MSLFLKAGILLTVHESHWSNESTMLEYILVPYMVKTRERLKLADDHPILAIFNVFKAHRCDSVLGELHHHHIHQVFIPARCTGKLQPPNVSVNEEFKTAMKANFSRWYANEVKEALDQAINIQDLKLTSRLQLQ